MSLYNTVHTDSFTAIIITITIFKEGAQLAKINNEIKIISHVIISKMLTVGIKKSNT